MSHTSLGVDDTNFCLKVVESDSMYYLIKHFSSPKRNQRYLELSGHQSFLEFWPVLADKMSVSGQNNVIPGDNSSVSATQPRIEKNTLKNLPQAILSLKLLCYLQNVSRVYIWISSNPQSLWNCKCQHYNKNMTILVDTQRYMYVCNPYCQTLLRDRGKVRCLDGWASPGQLAPWHIILSQLSDILGRAN